MRKKALIIAEKKSVATVYLQAIKQGGAKLPYDYDVLQFQGNVVELKLPEQVNPAWQKWQLDTLPMLPEKFEYTPIKANRHDSRQIKQYKARGYQYFKEAKRLLASGKYDVVVNGCDPDREGQSIFDKFMLLMPQKVQQLPQLRLWVGDMQVETSLKYLMQPLDNKDPEYVNFGKEARARGIMDWLWGLNASRAFSLQYGAGKPLPLGRGMTAILAMVVARNDAINHFVSVPYFEVELTTAAPSLKAILVKPTPPYHVMKIKTQAKAIQAQKFTLKQQQVIVKAISGLDKPQITPPPRYFNTSDLIAYISGHFHFAGKTITAALQQLYERKILTYPRTSGKTMTHERAANLAAIIAVAQAQVQNPALKNISITAEMQHNLKTNRRFVAKLKHKTGHDCLMLTGKAITQKLTPVQAAIVQAIATRVLLSLLPAERHYAVKILLTAGKTPQLFFKSSGNVLIERGWSEYHKPKFKYITLPEVALNQALTVADCHVSQHQTTPPKPFSQASLIKTMENIGRYYDDAKLKAAIKDHGIGTDATRQALIDKNAALKFWTINPKNGEILPTALGEEIIHTLKNHPLTRPELTAQWEAKLAQIAAGTLSLEAFINEAKAATKSLVAPIKNAVATPLPHAPSYFGNKNVPKSRSKAKHLQQKCPLDGGKIIVAANRFVCENHHATRKNNRWEQSGCPFVVPKKFAGQTLKNSDVNKMITLGRTPAFQFVSSRTHQPFVAALFWDKQKNQVSFQFGVSLEVR